MRRRLACRVGKPRFGLARLDSHLDGTTRRPGGTTNLIEHGTTDTQFGEGFEIVAAFGVVGGQGLDQTHHTCLDHIGRLDRRWQARSKMGCDSLDETHVRSDIRHSCHFAVGAVSHRFVGVATLHESVALVLGPSRSSRKSGESGSAGNAARLAAILRSAATAGVISDASASN